MTITPILPTVTPAVGQLTVTWPLPQSFYTSIVKWRKTGAGMWEQVVPAHATSCVLTGLDAVPYDVQVVLLGTGGPSSPSTLQYSPPMMVLPAKGVPLAPPPPPPKLRVAVINCSQKSAAVMRTCLEAGIMWDRVDIDDGSKLGLLGLAVRALPLYNPGTGISGGLNNRTAAQVSADITALITPLRTRQIVELEIGNEPWLNGDTATTYAAKYAAAKSALAGTGITAIAQVTGSYDKTGAGNWSDDKTAGWIRDFVAALPAGMKPDAFSAHPYPANGDPLAVSHEDTGWPALKSWHDIALGLGLDMPWYITEVGAEVSPPGGQAQQAAVIQRMLNSLHTADPLIPGTPFDWITFVAIYTAVDDSPTAPWGVLNADGTPRPAFPAVTAAATTA